MPEEAAPRGVPRDRKHRLFEARHFRRAALALLRRSAHWLTGKRVPGRECGPAGVAQRLSFDAGS